MAEHLTPSVPCLAFLITGRIKNWQAVSYEFCKNILEPLKKKFDVTIFLSTYKSEEGSSDIEEFIHTYDISFINIETFAKPNNHEVWSSADINGSKDSAAAYRYASCFYHNYRAFQMLQASGIKFDYAIKWRADILAFTELPRDTFDYPGILTIPHDIYQYKGREHFPDAFVVATLDAMKWYCNIYNNLESYYDEYHIYIGPDHCPESCIFKHVYIDEIPWKYTEDKWLWMTKRVYDSTRPDYLTFNVVNDKERSEEEKFYRNLSSSN